MVYGLSLYSCIPHAAIPRSTFRQDGKLYSKLTLSLTLFFVYSYAYRVAPMQ